jgi:hypothetical protein
MSLTGADVHSDQDTNDQLKAKPSGTKGKPRFWLREWQWYAILTVVGLAIILAGELGDIPYLVLAGIALTLFAIFGVAYGLLKERQMK